MSSHHAPPANRSVVHARVGCPADTPRPARAIVAGLGLAALLAAAAASAAPANRVTNPGFEEGRPGALPTAWSDQKEGGAEGTVAVTDELASGGKQSVLVENTNDTGYIHPNHEATLVPGVYAYRVRARSDRDGTFTMELYDTRAWADQKPAQLQLGNGLASREFSLRKDTWQTCEMTVVVTAEFPASLQIGLRHRGRLWLDDVELVAVGGPPAPLLADTGTPHAAALTPAELAARTGWKPVPQRPATFSGDACLSNRHLALVVRRGAPGAELYATTGAAGFRPVANLLLLTPAGTPATAIRSFAVYETYADKAVLDVTADTAEGTPCSLRVGLRQDRRYLETEARPGTARLRIAATAPFAAVPDLFGNDLVVNAARTPQASIRLPSERLLVGALAGNDALLVCAWPSTEQTVSATLAGDGPTRALTALDITLLPNLRAGVAVGVLAAPGVWFSQPIAGLKNPQGEKLDWRLPFDATWRVDFRRREDGLIDSWSPTRKRSDGNWDSCRDNGSRTMWTSSRDDLAYPAYLDNGSLYLVNAKFADAMAHTYFRGARDLTLDPADVAFVYPFDRAPATPPDTQTVADVFQQTLAETPELEAYAHLAPALMARHNFPATCWVTGRYEEFFDRDQEQTMRRTILDDLRRMEYFVLTKRERIEEYMTWVRATREWLTQAQAVHPPLAPLVARFGEFLTRMDDTYRKDRGVNMKTPPDCLALTEKVVALIDSTTEADKVAAARELGKATRSIGGAQDAVLGCLRQIMKELRQAGGLAIVTAQTDAEYGLARQLRDRTIQVLDRYCGHEWK